MTIERKKWLFRIVCLAIAAYFAVQGAFVWAYSGFPVFAIYTLTVTTLLAAAWWFGEFAIERFN